MKTSAAAAAARLGLAALVASWLPVGCDGCDAPAAVVDAGTPAVDFREPLAAAAKETAVATVMGRVGARLGACAQVRSLANEAEAEAAATAIRSATSFPVEVIAKDLGTKGTWHRVCVGDEADAARLIARATRWTAPSGVLAPFLDPPRSPDEPRFLVLAKTTAEARRPTDAQAVAVLERSKAGPIMFAGDPARPLLITAGPVSADSSAARIVAIDATGALVPLDPTPPPGCASCAVFEAQSPITGRRPLAVGDVAPAAGDEVLVEEETASGSRFLAVLAVDGAQLRRIGAVLLAAASADVVTRGEAFVVEADGDDDREIGVARLELRSLDGKLCALNTHVELWGASKDAARGLSRIDIRTLIKSPEADTAVVDFVTAVDGAGDLEAGSRACAEAMSDRPGTLITQLCLQRVRGLVADGRLVDAVNAAGALAEQAPTLRAAVAGPLFTAMQTLDADPRLSAAPYDCEGAPLVADTANRSVDETIKLARARLRERLSLSDIADAVFVTASRDFGADTPVFAIAARWMERLRASQPARHAAIEAALLPPSTPPPPEDPAPVAPGDNQGPGFGGAP